MMRPIGGTYRPFGRQYCVTASRCGSHLRFHCWRRVKRVFLNNVLRRCGRLRRKYSSANPTSRACNARCNCSRDEPNSEGLWGNPNQNLVDPSQLGYRQAYRLFKLTVANVARPRISNAMSGNVLRPFGCYYLRTTLRTLTPKYSADGQLALHTCGFCNIGSVCAVTLGTEQNMNSADLAWITGMPAYH
jgi:hypothetical protein